MDLLDDLAGDDSSNNIFFRATRAHVTVEYFCCTEDTPNNRQALRQAQTAFAWPEIDVSFSENIGCILYDDNYIDPSIRNTSYLALVPSDETQSALYATLRDFEATLAQNVPAIKECRTGLFHASLMALRTDTLNVPEIHQKVAQKWKSIKPDSFKVQIPNFADE